MKVQRLLLIVFAAAAALAVSCKQQQQQSGTQPGITSKAGPMVEIAADTVASRSPKLVEVDPDVPGIRLLSKGSILPSSGSLDLLFCSHGFGAAEVRVRRIYRSNVLQYMQYEQYEKNYEIRKVAHQVADTTIILGDATSESIKEERTYGLSLDEIIKPEPGAIYRVEIRGREPAVKMDVWEYDSSFGDYQTYDDRHVDLLASNLAIIAKGGDDARDIFVYNIISGKPVSGAKVKLFDYVQQEIAKGSTDGEGHVRFPAAGEARFVAASSGNDFSYLDLKNEKSLSTSGFDVSGAEHKDGLKVYLFGERGVWRPGDTLHVTAIAMYDGAALPAGHPVIAELRNPDGQVVSTSTQKTGGRPIWHFPFVTAKDAPTGRWSVSLTLGGQTFGKALRVETVKPNKLDIRVDFGKETITPDASSTGTIAVNWLYGAPGSGLRVEGDVDITPARTAFKGYPDYDFQDDTRSFDAQTLHYKEMRTDSEGKIAINSSLDLNKAQVPGMLNAGFTFRAYEPSGEFSTSYNSFRMSPFDRYVGIRTELEKSDWGSFIKIGKDHRFDVVCLDADGKPADTKLRAEIFHVDYSWWWNSTELIANYMAGSSKEVMMTAELSTKGGKASFSYDWADDPNGVYFIRVTDTKGGHAASMLCDAYDASGTGGAADGFVKLTVSSDKESYKVGETARLIIPSSAGSSALVSIEKGGKVLSTKRVACHAGSTEIHIPVTAAMLPNVYADITLIQPHGQTVNDAPIRMYGVKNINVEDASSRLSPVLDAPEQAKPETALKFKVREKDGKAMSYVVAVVDEGLLSLTGFKTPDAWKAFYSKEALRVRTWDLYDAVIGAYGGRIEQLFAIGGDEEAAGPLKRQGAERFTPVVSYLGPFDLKAGRTASHSIDIPQYIGTMRVMVIATDGKAQGSTQGEVNVTKPVMVQATLPRTLSTGERIKVPATLMTLKENVGNVKLSIKTDEKFSIVGPPSINVHATECGQSVEYFELQVGDFTGVGHVSVTAESASDKSVSAVEIDVLHPNPASTSLQSVLIEPGSGKDVTVPLTGIEGTNAVAVEFSSIPAIDLGGRMKYLTEYPYGCIEQITSAAFPQLYLTKVMDCDAAYAAKCTRNVTSAIARLQSYRRSDGSLSYWPGSASTSNFGTAYALHFLQEAENAGYAVPADLKSSVIGYISRKIVNDSHISMVDRAYGAFALALAGKPQRSAMNNLREKVSEAEPDAAWLLAAAYACDGKKDIAQKIVAGLPYANDKYDCFGSEDRNMAIALKTSMLCGLKEKAFDLAAKVAARLNDGSRYMSTQATAWSLCSICSYASEMDARGISATVKYDGKTSKVSSPKNIATHEVALKEQSGSVTLGLANNAGGTVYATVRTSGVPAAGTEKASASGISLKVKYVENGAEISVDTLSNGRVFKAVVTVTNTGSAAVENLALSHRFPSGWEIRNERMYSNVEAPAGITWQDFRDDRVYSFFDLKAGQSVNVSVSLTATYPGRFYLPAISCAAMYDSSVSAVIPGRWVEVKERR